MKGANEIMETQIDRRKTLHVLGFGLVGSMLLPACKKDEVAAAPKPAPAAAPPPPAPVAVAPPPPAAAPDAPAAPAAPDAPAAPAAEAKAEGDVNCKEAAPIDETSKGLRRALQYKEKTDDAAKKCSGCAQFEAKKYGGCGACKLFTGAVNPNGVCLSYAPLAAK
jgi:type IV secretory pathway VirB10-like protein